MKKLLVIWGGLLVAIHAFGQTNDGTEAGCSCPSCIAKAAGKTPPFTLPGLQELNAGLENTPAPEQGTDDQAHDEHVDCDHDHGTEEATHEHVEQAFQPAHPDHEDHVGHDHGEAEGVALSVEMMEKVGLQIREAGGGTIAKTAVFPAEIKLNRDRAAAVSARYESIVRQVVAEIGDEVKKEDVLATLENRETLAVYTLSAPLDGLIISKDAAVGEAADAERVLFEVADLSTVWADISIFPQYSHHVRKGQRVMLIASDGHRAETAIKYISPLVSSETRTLQARCILEGAEEDFTPGAFVRAEVAIQTREVAVRVEKEAVQILEGRPVVFIADEHGFEPRDVELGLSNRNFVEIKAGLEHGEKYVAKGAFELKAERVTSGLDPHAGHGH